MIRIGIIAVQGAVVEHQRAVERSLQSIGMKGEVVLVRSIEGLNSVDGLIIPGGESTTISKLIIKFGLSERLRQRVTEERFPVMGTCAGSVLLAIEGDEEVMKTGTELLKLMDYGIARNAFGRQRQSFELQLNIDWIDEPERPFPGVFIRAPLITKTWGRIEGQVKMPDESGIIAAKQDRLMAVVFHPELTDDLRLHELFIKSIE